MDEIPGHTEERPPASWTWVTINGVGWRRPSCMRNGGTWRRCHQQDDDRWEKMKVDGKGDGEEAGGWSV